LDKQTDNDYDEPFNFIFCNGIKKQSPRDFSHDVFLCFCSTIRTTRLGLKPFFQAKGMILMAAFGHNVIAILIQAN
jgi:hypothetical protein